MRRIFVIITRHRDAWGGAPVSPSPVHGCVFLLYMTADRYGEYTTTPEMTASTATVTSQRKPAACHAASPTAQTIP